jgi:4-diphosphocytidyl-2-C-methyl-D-erythritol kinase
LPDIPPTECVLALPDVGVSTPQAYRDWDQLQGAGGGLTTRKPSDKLDALSRALASAFGPRPPEGLPAGVGAYSSGVTAWRGDLAGNSDVNPLLALVRTGIENDFEEVVFRQHPSLGTIKRILAESVDPKEAALYAALSGSGSAVFGLYGSAGAAEASAARLATAGIRALRTKTLGREEYWGMMFEE